MEFRDREERAFLQGWVLATLTYVTFSTAVQIGALLLLAYNHT